MEFFHYDPNKLILQAAFMGGFIYWFRGQKSTAVKPALQAFFALPYAGRVYAAGFPWWVALGVWIITTAAVWTGHGNWQALTQPNYPPPGDDKERLEPLIYWLKPHLPDYWYKVIGLTLTGLVVTLPTGLLLLSPSIVLSAFWKPAAYMFGWWTYPRQKHFAPTQIGEAGTGAGMWSTLVMSL